MKKIALAMIVAARDEEADVLSRCLKNICDHVDDIFITITGKNKRVRMAAEAFGAKISYFEWINDFAAARNFNFSQVPQEYDYILWLDADDMVRGGENIRNLIENNDADGYVMDYLYAFDEFNNPIVVHPKTRIVKNDKCVEWSGHLHEDFKNNRAIDMKKVTDIEVLHLTDKKRIDSAKQRNLIVSKHQMDKLDEDPRSYWNLANSYKALGMNKEAIKIFDEFLKKSSSDDEKYVVRLRMSESYWAMGDINNAIESARYAIGTMPTYPDAYNLLGAIYLETQQPQKAIENYKISLGIVGNGYAPVHKIIVYNPRDYDYVPLVNLAKAYYQASMPMLALDCLKAAKEIQKDDKSLTEIIEKMQKEVDEFNKIIEICKELDKIADNDKLKDELAKIDEKYQSHPAICRIRNTRLVKEKSSGKDLVIYCGYTAAVWDPDVAKNKGIGGSEEAVIHISQGLAKKGWNVTVYNNCGSREKKFGDVIYKPYWAWNYRDKQDVVIIWRHPKPCDYEINAPVVIMDMHDVIGFGEFNDKRLNKISKIFVKSKFHRDCFKNVADDKFVIIPNGIVTERFSGNNKKDNYLLINTSSPDRGLKKLIKLFKRVKEQVPEAKCKWAYGWGVWDVVHGSSTNKMAWKKETEMEMEEAGIENLGRINHEQVADLYNEARIFAYPSEFAEIDCISLTKSMRAGAMPVTTDFAAMGEKKHEGGVFLKSSKNHDTWCEADQFDFSMADHLDDKWVEAVVKILKEQPPVNEDMRKWADKFSWELIIDSWDKELNNLLKI